MDIKVPADCDLAQAIVDYNDEVSKNRGTTRVSDKIFKRIKKLKTLSIEQKVNLKGPHNLTCTTRPSGGVPSIGM
jgi:hypothetical protein